MKQICFFIYQKRVSIQIAISICVLRLCPSSVGVMDHESQEGKSEYFRWGCNYITEKLWYSESSKLVPHWVIMLTDEAIKTSQGKYRYRILKGSIIPSDTVTRKSDTIDRRNEIIRLIKNGILVSIKIDEKLFYRFEHDSDCTYSTGKARKIASLGTDGRFGFSRFETDNCSDTFDLISECTGILQLSDAEIITPHYVVKNIIGQLPSSVFNPKTRFLDPSVKSGRFLVEVYSALFRAPEMIKYFPDEGARKRYILHNQLFGLATLQRPPQ